MPADNPDPLSILTAAHEARRMAYYRQLSGLENALHLLKFTADPKTKVAYDAVLAARDIYHDNHRAATQAEDDAVRALLRDEASASSLERVAPDAR